MKKIGREVLFIEAKENNLRNGEGAFIRLKNNAIMFGYTEYFGNDWEDDATARIVAITSYDDGGTKVYAYKNFTIIKMYRLDGNRDMYICNANTSLNDLNK